MVVLGGGAVSYERGTPVSGTPQTVALTPPRDGLVLDWVLTPAPWSRMAGFRFCNTQLFVSVWVSNKFYHCERDTFVISSMG